MENCDTSCVRPWGSVRCQQPVAINKTRIYNEITKLLVRMTAIFCYLSVYITLCHTCNLQREKEKRLEAGPTFQASMELPLSYNMANWCGGIYPPCFSFFCLLHIICTYSEVRPRITVLYSCWTSLGSSLSLVGALWVYGDGPPPRSLPTYPLTPQVVGKVFWWICGICFLPLCGEGSFKMEKITVSESLQFLLVVSETEN